MDTLLNGLGRVARRLELLTLDVCALLALVMCSVLLGELAARNIFSTSFVWSIELSTVCFVWMSFLGGTVAVRRHEHFNVDLIEKWAPPGSLADLSLKFLAVVIVGGIGAVLLWKGIPFASAGMRRFSFSLGIPQGYTMLVMPIAGGLILFYSLVDLLSLSLRQRPDGAVMTSQTGEVAGV